MICRIKLLNICICANHKVTRTFVPQHESSRILPKSESEKDFKGYVAYLELLLKKRKKEKLTTQSTSCTVNIQMAFFFGPFSMHSSLFSHKSSAEVIKPSNELVTCRSMYRLSTLALLVKRKNKKRFLVSDQIANLHCGCRNKPRGC